MKISIYQIKSELDTQRLKFMDLDFIKRQGYKYPPADIYEAVYHGEVDAQNLGEVYRMFNRITEADVQFLEQIGFYGHSLSVSDIVEIFESDQISKFYFCSMIGFQQISFNKEAISTNTSASYKLP